MAESPHPWDRQEGEPVLWYDRFDRFRAMGPTRSLRGLYADESGKGKEGQDGTRETVPINAPTSWREAAVEWRWRERAEAFDLAEIEKRRAGQEKAMEQLHREGLGVANSALLLGGLRIRNLQKTPDVLSPRDAIAMVDLSMKLRMFARQDPLRELLAMLRDLGTTEDDPTPCEIADVGTDGETPDARLPQELPGCTGTNPEPPAAEPIPPQAEAGPLGHPLLGGLDP